MSFRDDMRKLSKEKVSISVADSRDIPIEPIYYNTFAKIICNKLKEEMTMLVRQRRYIYNNGFWGKSKFRYEVRYSFKICIANKIFDRNIYTATDGYYVFDDLVSDGEGGDYKVMTLASWYWDDIKKSLISLINQASLDEYDSLTVGIRDEVELSQKSIDKIILPNLRKYIRINDKGELYTSDYVALNARINCSETGEI